MLRHALELGEVSAEDRSRGYGGAPRPHRRQPLEIVDCTVRIGSPLRSYTNGASSVGASGATVAEVLADLEGRFPGIRFRMIDEQDRIRRHIRVFVNDREAATLAEPVAGGDQVHLICALSGG